MICWTYSVVSCNPIIVQNCILHIVIVWKDCRICEEHFLHSTSLQVRAQQRRSHLLSQWSRADTWAENNGWTLNPSISKCCQLSMRRRVKFIFCKVRKCWWKNGVGTDRGVITSNPCSEFRHSFIVHWHWHSTHLSILSWFGTAACLQAPGMTCWDTV